MHVDFLRNWQLIEAAGTMCCPLHLKIVLGLGSGFALGWVGGWLFFFPPPYSEEEEVAFEYYTASAKYIRA